MRSILAALFLLLLAAAAAADDILPCRALDVLPHDPRTFTEGLVFKDGLFYESSGLYGASNLAVREPETGRVLRRFELDAWHFAEGLALHRGTLFLLTWKEGKVLTFDADTLSLGRTYPFRGEGWGLTVLGGRLVASDGTDRLRFLDPATLKETGEVRVRSSEGPVDRLNELEAVDGLILANVWETDRIAAIDPGDGRVRFFLDLAPLRLQLSPESGVANGVAFDQAGRRLFVTGKNWNLTFRIAWPPDGLSRPAR